MSSVEAVENAQKKQYEAEKKMKNAKNEVKKIKNRMKKEVRMERDKERFLKFALWGMFLVLIFGRLIFSLF